MNTISNDVSNIILKSWPFILSRRRLLLHQFKPTYNINTTLMSRKNGINVRFKLVLIKMFTGLLTFKSNLIIHFNWSCFIFFLNFIYIFFDIGILWFVCLAPRWALVIYLPNKYFWLLYNISWLKWYKPANLTIFLPPCCPWSLKNLRE